jgi:hypothetical protein
MGLLRVLLVILLGVLGFQHAERAVVERSMSTLQPPYVPHPMRMATIIAPPIPPLPPPPPPSPFKVAGAT